MTLADSRTLQVCAAMWPMSQRDVLLRSILPWQLRIVELCKSARRHGTCQLDSQLDMLSCRQRFDKFLPRLEYTQEEHIGATFTDVFADQVDDILGSVSHLLPVMLCCSFKSCSKTHATHTLL